MSRIGRGGLIPRARSVLRGLLSDPPRRERAAPCVVVGHRGAAKREPENTLRSFRRAVAWGADAIETDICVTSDGEFVLWHDADPDEKVALARQLGCEGLAYRPEVPEIGSAWRRPVRELTLRTLTAHHRYRRCDDIHPNPGSPIRAEIQALERLLGWARGEPALTDIYLDLKFADDQADAATAFVGVLTAAGANADRVGPTYHLLSTQPNVLRALAAAVAGRGIAGAAVRVSADFELPPTVDLAIGLGAREISLGSGGRLWSGYFADVARVLEARDSGAIERVTAWTINDAKKLKSLLRAGVDAILTDEPARLRALAGPAPPVALPLRHRA